MTAQEFQDHARLKLDLHTLSHLTPRRRLLRELERLALVADQGLDELRHKLITYRSGDFWLPTGGISKADMDVPPVITILLVGLSGSGKSSLVNLMGVFQSYDDVFRRTQRPEIGAKPEDDTTTPPMGCQLSSARFTASPVNCAVLVVNLAEITKAFNNGDLKPVEATRDLFRCPAIRKSNEKPLLILTHGDQLTPEERSGGRLKLCEYLGVAEATGAYDIPCLTELGILRLNRSSLSGPDPIRSDPSPEEKAQGLAPHLLVLDHVLTSSQNLAARKWGTVEMCGCG
ncbi:hypothetical protein CK203_081079 [Vitis vinifera]|uniref:Uncharacterized protein n=1 Tax=Vitis vinifera TaxID=29760 RepID=A0A438DWS8_VITVI|nr:hypothetical protein CK203_081079 [Vitis vinifera]